MSSSWEDPLAEFAEAESMVSRKTELLDEVNISGVEEHQP